LLPYKVHEIYLFGSNQPNIYIDVTETIDLKGQGLQCHVSQLGPDGDMISHIKERAAMVAKEAKVKKGLDMQYAEAFRRVKFYIPPEARS
jgi:LmbE family N-acetylglucosaminyl deacetylase